MPKSKCMERKRIMPSLVATMSALARTTLAPIKNKNGQVLTDKGVYKGHFIKENPCQNFLLCLCIYKA